MIFWIMAERKRKFGLKDLIALILTILITQKMDAQCPSNINSGGPFVINDGDDCLITGFINTSENVTIKNGGKLTLDANLVSINGGTIIVEDGGELVVDGNTQIINDGVLRIESGGTGLFDNIGNLEIGHVAGSSGGTLHVDGSVLIDGRMNLRALGILSGTGFITVTEDIDDNGGDHSNWSGTEVCGGSCDPLPVELIEFTVEISEGFPVVKWKTTTELNNYGFYIEKSDDGNKFETIDFVKGVGTSNVVISYRYEDRSEVAGFFYRLKQVDYDGQYEYSPVISLQSILENRFAVYPTPFIDRLHLRGPEEAAIKLELLDLSKRSIFEASGSSLFNLEQILNDKLHQLIPSVYFIKIQSDGQITIVKIIKGKS